MSLSKCSVILNPNRNNCGNPGLFSQKQIKFGAHYTYSDPKSNGGIGSIVSAKCAEGYTIKCKGRPTARCIWNSEKLVWDNAQKCACFKENILKWYSKYKIIVLGMQKIFSIKRMFWPYTQHRVQEMSMGEAFVRAVLISGDFEGIICNAKHLDNESRGSVATFSTFLFI